MIMTPAFSPVTFNFELNVLYLIYTVCVCLRIVVSKTYCVVFLHGFSSSYVPYVASFSGLFIFDCPFLFPIVYSNVWFCFSNDTRSLYFLRKCIRHDKLMCNKMMSLSPNLTSIAKVMQIKY